jgi:hypothetical protein
VKLRVLCERVLRGWNGESSCGVETGSSLLSFLSPLSPRDVFHVWLVG